MKVDSSAVHMSGSSSSLATYTREETLRMWAGKERPDFEGRDLPTGRLQGLFQADTLELSGQARSLIAQGKGAEQADPAGKTTQLELSEQDKQKLLLVQRMIEMLTGKKIKFYVLKEINLEAGKSAFANPIKAPPSAVQPRQGWGLEYDLRESCYEQQKMSFTAQGTVRTADGREINFSVQLNMSREFASQHNLTIRAGDAALVDPLVINFSGSAPSLTETKFSFDLDSDGHQDQISFVGPGSGLLALDLDGDGRINNGMELFGPSSGDGFAELARYDEDGNQWIDESDPIYERLRIWTKDQNGNDVLFALGQKNVGAIFLGNVSTLFDLKDQANNLQGQVKKKRGYT